jgi:hypothetical protein
MLFLMLLPLILLPGGWSAAQTITATDDDLDQLIRAVQITDSSVNGCELNSCPQFECTGAIALSQALSSAQGALRGLAPVLHDHYELLLMKLDELDSEYSANESRKLYVQRYHTLSKYFSLLGRFFLTLASISEAYNSVGEYMNNMQRIPDLSELQAAGISHKPLADNAVDSLIFQIANLSSIAEELRKGSDELRELREGSDELRAIDPGSDEDLKKRIIWVAEAGNAAQNLKTQYDLYQAQLRVFMTSDWSQIRLRKLEEAHSELGKTWTGIGQVVGKIGLEVAESGLPTIGLKGQKDLEDEMREIARVQAALNKNYIDILPDLTRTGDRYIKVLQATNKLQVIFAKSRVCVTQCPNPPDPSAGPEVPRDKTGEPYAAAALQTYNAASPESTGTAPRELWGAAALQTYNKEIPTLTTNIASAAANFTAKGGTTPRISVPSPVRPSADVSAHYLIGACKETDDAEIHLLDPHFKPNKPNDTMLGAAIRNKDGTVEFVAPEDTGEYKVLIKNKQSGILAVAPFSVESVPIQAKTGKLEARSFAFDVFYTQQQYRFQVTLTPGYEVRADGSAWIVPPLNHGEIWRITKTAIKGSPSDGGGAARDWAEGYADQRIKSVKELYDDGEVLDLGVAPKSSAHRLVGIEITFRIDSGYERAPVSGVEMQPDGNMIARLKWVTNIPLQ